MATHYAGLNIFFGIICIVGELFRFFRSVVQKEAGFFLQPGPATYHIYGDTTRLCVCVCKNIIEQGCSCLSTTLNTFFSFIHLVFFWYTHICLFLVRTHLLVFFWTTRTHTLPFIHSLAFELLLHSIGVFFDIIL